MIDVISFALTGYIPVVLILASLLNISKIEWTVKKVFFAAAAIQAPIIVTIAIFNITMLALYVWVLLVILVLRFLFKQSWRQSIFAGIFANFINVSVEYIMIFTIISLPETSQALILDNMHIPRIIAIGGFALLYVFSRRLENSEYSLLEYFSTIHWAIYFLTLAFFADFNLAQMYDVRPTMHEAPELVTIVLFIIFFLYNLIYLNKLNGNIAEKLKIEQRLENAERELKLQQFYMDSIAGFRHDFGNILNSIHGMVDGGEIEKLKSELEEMTVKIISSQTMQIANKFREIPVLHGILLDKITRADMRKIRLGLSIVGGKPDLQYCSDLDYGRMVGILLDNALEAAEESELREVDFAIRAKPGKRLETMVMNSCDTEVDIDRIFERGYSTKSNSSGEGLYQIHLIREKYQKMGRSIDIKTTLRNGFFTQIFKI